MTARRRDQGTNRNPERLIGVRILSRTPREVTSTTGTGHNSWRTVAIRTAAPNASIGQPTQGLDLPPAPTSPVSSKPTHPKTAAATAPRSSVKRFAMIRSRSGSPPSLSARVGVISNVLRPTPILNASGGGPVQDHLSGLPRQHRLESGRVVVDREPMGDHGRDVQARLQHSRHLVPGLEHFAAVDAFDHQPL